MHPLIVPLGAEAFAYALRGDRRKSHFAMARRRADRLGRPLVTVGAPGGGLTGGYTCGNANGQRGLPCVDLYGCSACGAPPTDLTLPGAIRSRDNGCVVFSSCVMELVPDIDAAWRETLRAAGSAENVFVVHIEPWAHAAWMYPGTRWRIEQAPPVGPLRYRAVETVPGTPAR